MPFRTCIVLAVAALLAVGCGGHAPTPGSHPASSAAPSLSCRQQVQNWKQGPARAAFSRLKAALKQVQAAGKSGDVAGMEPAIKELVPTAYALAGHPMPVPLQNAASNPDLTLWGTGREAGTPFPAQPGRAMLRVKDELGKEAGRLSTSGSTFTASAPRWR